MNRYTDTENSATYSGLRSFRYVRRSDMGGVVPALVMFELPSGPGRYKPSNLEISPTCCGDKIPVPSTAKGDPDNIIYYQ